MNLKPLVGQRVFVQFRMPFFMVVDAGGDPAPQVINDKTTGDTGHLALPFMQGTFVERHDNICFQYTDSDTGRRIEVLFHPDVIANVAFVNPEQPERSRIVLPPS